MSWDNVIEYVCLSVCHSPVTAPCFLPLPQKQVSLVRCVQLLTALFLNLYSKIQVVVVVVIKMYNIKFYNIYSSTCEIY